jgi:hypothetical protein
MESFSQIAQQSKAYSRLAETAFPEGVALYCRTCGASRLLSKDETAKCLRTGWPRCSECQIRMEIQGL